MSQNLAFGFFDAGINELLRKYPAFVSGYDCLLTCMDSTSETAGALRRLFPTLDVIALGSFAVVSGDFVLQHRERLFTGFDEFTLSSRADGEARTSSSGRNISPAIGWS